MDPLSPAWWQMLPILAPPLLLSLTLHEFAHARAALAFGDRTALNAGRVTLNPLAHLDPIGTAMIFIVGFGWAKPVPVMDSNLHPRRLGEIVVSVAGVGANFALAICCGLGLMIFMRVLGPSEYTDVFVAWVGRETDSTFLALTGTSGMVFLMLLHALSVNVLLGIFNLVPLFPLDGHHVVRELLPYNAARNFMAWQMRFGRVLLLALIIGPRILSQLTGRYVPGPISYVYMYAQRFAFDLFSLIPG
ncbi:MAG: site-2 protease family protein [Planctomycetes bacterium]|nr:site-2 protease family protein [Planctomycetota bacterium]